MRMGTLHLDDEANASSQQPPFWTGADGLLPQDQGEEASLPARPYRDLVQQDAAVTGVPALLAAARELHPMCALAPDADEEGAY